MNAVYSYSFSPISTIGLCGQMDKPVVFGSEDCRCESCHDHQFGSVEFKFSLVTIDHFLTSHFTVKELFGLCTLYIAQIDTY